MRMAIVGTGKVKIWGMPSLTDVVPVLGDITVCVCRLSSKRSPAH